MDPGPPEDKEGDSSRKVSTSCSSRCRSIRNAAFSASSSATRAAAVRGVTFSLSWSFSSFSSFCCCCCCSPLGSGVPLCPVDPPLLLLPIGLVCCHVAFSFSEGGCTTRKRSRAFMQRFSRSAWMCAGIVSTSTARSLTLAVSSLPTEMTCNALPDSHVQSERPGQSHVWQFAASHDCRVA